MENRYRTIILTFTFLTALIFYSCASESTYLVNLSFVKDAIIDYHESGQFHKDTERIVNDAINKFEKVVPGEKSVVIFDVDETALSNYPFNKEWDFGYVAKYFDMWVDSAKAPAVAEVLRLYKYLAERNFRIIFITARKDFQYEATYQNLINVGYDVFDTLIVKDSSYSGQSALKYKSDKRTELTKMGYTIAGTVGDQWSDLNGPYHGIQIKIPDYQYYIH